MSLAGYSLGSTHDDPPALLLQIAQLGLGVFDSLPEVGQSLAIRRQLGLQATREPPERGQSALALVQLLIAPAVGDAAVGERAAFLRVIARGITGEFPAVHLLRRRVVQYHVALKYRNRGIATINGMRCLTNAITIGSVTREDYEL